MKESLKRRLNVFLKLRRRLASIKWILLFITTVMFFLSAASSTCTFSFGGDGPILNSGSPSGEASPAIQSSPMIQSSPPISPSSPSQTLASTPTVSDPPTSKIVPVKMVEVQAGCGFSPALVTINKGDTLIWTNTTSAAHTIMSDAGGGLLKSPQIGPNGMYSFKFNITGTFQYHCDSPTSTAVGTVVVGTA